MLIDAELDISAAAVDMQQQRVFVEHQMTLVECTGISVEMNSLKIL